MKKSGFLSGSGVESGALTSPPSPSVTVPTPARANDEGARPAFDIMSASNVASTLIPAERANMQDWSPAQSLFLRPGLSGAP